MKTNKFSFNSNQILNTNLVSSNYDIGGRDWSRIDGLGSLNNIDILNFIQ